MRKPVLVVRPYRHRPPYKFILDLRAYDKGRMFFKTRAEADAECLRQKTLLERHSREAVGLSQREMSDFITARNKLAEYGMTLNDAVEYFVDHLERVRRCKVTVSQFATEVLEAKRRDGLSPSYVNGLRFYFNKFCQHFGQRLIADITVEELDKWLRDLPVAPKTRADYRAHIGVLFSHAKRRRMIDSNPIEFTAKPKLVGGEPQIFDVDELRSLLEEAHRTEPSVLPMLAIGAFAGLRDAEIKRLDWSEVDLVRRRIDLKAAKAKSAKRRLVDIQPNLAAWLRPCGKMKGRVVPEGARGKVDRVCKAAGLTTWPKNGLRHSFASYRLAATNNAPLVAAELGHTSPTMLYSVYRELVLPEEAQRYWKIEPVAEAERVVAFKAGV